MTQFAANKLTNKGREFPARITEAGTSTKTFQNEEKGTSEDVTQLTLRFDRPDGKYELEFYRIPDAADKEITKRSDLGKLIEHFKKMGIDDIGEDDFAPLHGLYVLVGTVPRQNRKTGEANDKRFPVRKLTADEIEEYFGANAAGAAKPKIDTDAIFAEIAPAVLAVVDGLQVKGFFSKLAAIPSVANHPKAESIFEAANKGEFTKWLESTGHITTDNGVISVTASTNGAAAADAAPADAAAETVTAD